MGANYGYSVKPDPEKTAIASAREIPVKPKHVVNVCKAIRGMRLEQAKNYLEGVQELKIAVPFVRYKRKVAHRRGKIGPGQFPEKAAGYVLRVVKSAEANAEFKGLDPERMWISHAAMQKSAPIQGSMPRAQGRATPWNTSTCHIEIVLEEREAREAAEEKPKAKAKGGEKPKAKKAAPKKAGAKKSESKETKEEA
jgi:large subunit ribosomal protein L22